MKCIDAHMHLWNLDTGRYPWLANAEDKESAFGNLKKLAVNYLLNDYRNDCKSFDSVGLVHVEAAWDATDPVAETRWLAKILADFELPYAIVAGGNLLQENFPEVLAAHRSESSHVVGVRHILNYHQNPDYTFTDDPNIIFDKTWRRNFAHLGEQEMIFDLQIFPSQAKAAAELAQEYPDTKIVINHFIMPITWDQTGIAEWKVGLAQLAAHPSIAIKLSGLYMYHREWPISKMDILINTALDLFGPERVMWASNFPVDRQFVSMATLTSSFEESLAKHGASVRDAVMWKNANTWYRLNEI